MAPFSFPVPVKLPNDLLTCGPHGYEVCPICWTDVSFLEEEWFDGQGDDSEEDAISGDGDESARDATETLATESASDRSTDLSSEGEACVGSFSAYPWTELRAVIEALRACVWWGEGFNTVVITTDSDYSVEGATGWATIWVRFGTGSASQKAIRGGFHGNQELLHHLVAEFGEDEVVAALKHLLHSGIFELDEETASARFSALLFDQAPKVPGTDASRNMAAAPQTAADAGDTSGLSGRDDCIDGADSDEGCSSSSGGFGTLMGDYGVAEYQLGGWKNTLTLMLIARGVTWTVAAMRILEKACFDFAKRLRPDILAKNGWKTWLLARARPWPPPKPTGTDLSFLCDIRDTAVHSVHLVHLIATEASRLLRAAVSLLRAPEVGSVRDKLPDEVRQEVELTTKTMKSKAELLISIARDDFRAQREELRAKEKAKVAEILERACEPSGGG
ncbi:hypothetical protein VUR80DRAFT_2745 [Thermomyces stellatus]